MEIDDTKLNKIKKHLDSVNKTIMDTDYTYKFNKGFILGLFYCDHITWNEFEELKLYLQNETR